MTDLQGWQKVAREIGDHHIAGLGLSVLKSGPEHTIGDWLPAEAAAKEILRLREDSNTVALNEDVHKLLRELGISDHARPVSCHRVVNDEILPAIKRLRDRNAVLERVYEALAMGFAMKTHDLSMNQSWVVDDVEEVREALAAADQQQEIDR